MKLGTNRRPGLSLYVYLLVLVLVFAGVAIVLFFLASPDKVDRIQKASAMQNRIDLLHKDAFDSILRINRVQQNILSRGDKNVDRSEMQDTRFALYQIKAKLTHSEAQLKGIVSVDELSDDKKPSSDGKSSDIEVEKSSFNTSIVNGNSSIDVYGLNDGRHGYSQHYKRTKTHSQKTSTALARSFRKVDPKIDNLKVFHPSFNKSERLLTLSELTIEANRRNSVKGKFVPYNHNFTSVLTRGEYYQYDQNYSDPCLKHYISLKYDLACGDSVMSIKDVKRILVVAVQRSGTHYTWEMLNRLGIKVHHEGVGEAGAVSWIYAVNSASNMRADVGAFTRNYIINNPIRLIRQRFEYVFHQVRHPIRVIATLVNRCELFDRFWLWISTTKGFESITRNQTPLQRAMLLYILWNKHIERYADIRYLTEVTSPRDVCKWSGYSGKICSQESSTVPDKAIVEPSSPDHVTLLVNKTTIASTSTSTSTSTSEGRNSSESSDAPRRRLSARLMSRPNALKQLRNSFGMGYKSPSRDRGKSVEPPPPPAKTNKTDIIVTWKMLEDEDPSLCNEVKIMCIEYGYDLDPDTAPQNSVSKKFTA